LPAAILKEALESVRRAASPRLFEHTAAASLCGLLGFPAPERFGESLVEARQQLAERATGGPRVLRLERAEQIEHQPPLL
jgi:hypothetical protein